MGAFVAELRQNMRVMITPKRSGKASFQRWRGEAAKLTSARRHGERIPSSALDGASKRASVYMRAHNATIPANTPMSTAIVDGAWSGQRNLMPSTIGTAFKI